MAAACFSSGGSAEPSPVAPSTNSSPTTTSTIEPPLTPHEELELTWADQRAAITDDSVDVTMIGPIGALTVWPIYFASYPDVYERINDRGGIGGRQLAVEAVDYSYVAHSLEQSLDGLGAEPFAVTQHHRGPTVAHRRLHPEPVPIH